MATIDQLDLSVYNLYAMRTKMLEQINTQFRLSEASTIPPQTLVQDNYPKITELDILLGVVPLMTPWAYIFPPQQFRYLRRSPFAFYRVASSLGSLEQQAKDEQTIKETVCNSPEEEQEKAAILGCLGQIDKLNSLLGFIVGRVGQFLQG